MEEYYEEYLEKLAQKNPNIILDQDTYMRQTLIKILTKQKELITKNGNIECNGIVIKGAPSLGTKFNPNFSYG